MAITQQMTDDICYKRVCKYLAKTTEVGCNEHKTQDECKKQVKHRLDCLWSTCINKEAHGRG